MIGSYSYLFQDFTTSVENNIYEIEFPARQTPKEVRLGLCQRKTFDENCLNFVQLSKSKVVGDTTRNQGINPL